MLEVDHITIAIGGRIIVNHASMTMRAGECWAVLGPNGAGKSLLLHTLAGLREPASGTVSFEGQPLSAWRRRALAARIGLLLQDEASDYWGTVREYVALGRLPHRGLFGERDACANEAIDQALAALDLSRRASQLYRTLSGGERQRARLAQLIAQAPLLFLLDEPLNHLDLAQQTSAMRLAAQLAQSGRTVACTVHDPAWVLRYCSHAVLMYDSGRLVQGPVAEVVTHQALEALYDCRLEWAGPSPYYGPRYR